MSICQYLVLRSKKVSVRSFTVRLFQYFRITPNPANATRISDREFWLRRAMVDVFSCTDQQQLQTQLY
jgi:hypothetical protein